MAHAMYITDAIVCGSYHHNTSDKTFLLFTREFGMLFATARSVREERSKQRTALQDFSVIRVSLVKGKSGWRIGSTEAHANPFMAAVSRPARAGITYLIKTMRRYVQGEQAMPRAFDDLEATLAAIEASTDVHLITQWQQVYIIRLLYTLGYVALEASLQALIEAANMDEAVAAYTPALNASLEAKIAQAEAVSHL